jgi:hypothetical protein
MNCKYNDGLKVEYSDSLHVTMGEDINVFIEKDYIPSNIKHYLRTACDNSDCDEVRKIAEAVTNTVGRKACFADIDSKACVNY